MLIIIALLISIIGSFAQDKDLTIILHAIPHTHLDAGWIQTFDAYYDRYVGKIMETLIARLEQNPLYRFNWAETGFLQKWWFDERFSNQLRFKDLVD